MDKGQLIFFCGKMGAGKTTLSHQLAEEEHCIRISEDEWLEALYPNQVLSIKDYKRCSDLLKPLVEKLVVSLLENDQKVILDFPANTPNQRSWLKSISDRVSAPHVCYYLDVTDQICLQQIKARANPKTDTEEMFYAMRRYFSAPSDDEMLNVKVVQR